MGDINNKGLSKIAPHPKSTPCSIFYPNLMEWGLGVLALAFICPSVRPLHIQRYKSCGWNFQHWEHHTIADHYHNYVYKCLLFYSLSVPKFHIIPEFTYSPVPLPAVILFLKCLHTLQKAISGPCHAKGPQREYHLWSQQSQALKSWCRYVEWAQGTLTIYYVVCYRKCIEPVTSNWVVLQWYFLAWHCLLKQRELQYSLTKHPSLKQISCKR